MKPFRLTPDHYVFLTLRPVLGVVPFVTCSNCRMDAQLTGDIVRRAVQWVMQHEPKCAPVKSKGIPRGRHR